MSLENIYVSTVWRVDRNDYREYTKQSKEGVIFTLLNVKTQLEALTVGGINLRLGIRAVRTLLLVNIGKLLRIEISHDSGSPRARFSLPHPVPRKPRTVWQRVRLVYKSCRFKLLSEHPLALTSLKGNKDRIVLLACHGPSIHTPTIAITPKLHYLNQREKAPAGGHHRDCNATASPFTVLRLLPH
jgi:hypothetical protein